MQVILVQFSQAVRVPRGVSLLPVRAEHGTAYAVAPTYFTDITNVRRAVGASCAAEPLVDGVWEAQVVREPFKRTRLGRLFAALVEQSLPFVCWSGDDASALPIARTWDDVESEALRQTVRQGDLFLRYVGRG